MIIIIMYNRDDDDNNKKNNNQRTTDNEQDAIYASGCKLYRRRPHCASIMHYCGEATLRSHTTSQRDGEGPSGGFVRYGPHLAMGAAGAILQWSPIRRHRRSVI